MERDRLTRQIAQFFGHRESLLCQFESFHRLPRYQMGLRQCVERIHHCRDITEVLTDFQGTAMEVFRLVHLISIQRSIADGTEEDRVVSGPLRISCKGESFSADLHRSVIISDANVQPGQLAEHADLLSIFFFTFETRNHL